MIGRWHNNKFILFPKTIFNNTFILNFTNEVL
jgi:hypothetical protein